MSLDDLWLHYRVSGYAGAASASPSDPLDLFYLALLAFGQDAFAPALTHARQAAAHDLDHLVYAHAATYLQRVIAHGKQSVYVSGQGLAAFIRGGGNTSLYAATSAALRQAYQQQPASTLLDIGVGDGLALLPALVADVRHIDLIEPSSAMLAQVSAALAERRVPHRAHATTLQAFVQAQSGTWDIVQATFSLQSIAPAERADLFQWLRQHGQRLLITEFDVPVFEHQYAPDHVYYVVEHYRQGLAEYDADRDLVAQEFLMPVMFGYFDQTAARTNYEQPVDNWVVQLRTAGFDHVEARQLYPYWWAPAYLLDASATSL